MLSRRERRRTRRSSIQVVSAHPGVFGPTNAAWAAQGRETCPDVTSRIFRPVAWEMGTAGSKCATKVGKEAASGGTKVGHREHFEWRRLKEGRRGDMDLEGA